MGSEYDCKFEEMKKYIPFLESMIKRLESTTSSSNPRQAQLDKIRSLRDLLLDKKKRMKMDNLLKCEQVLVNLYAKVEQKDTLPVVKVENMDSSKDTSDLETVRNKLKTVVKMQNITETLPEIARASEIEEICEPGSKEPALFQRRPNMPSLSPTKHSPRKAYETKSQSRRSYTRVLVSPEPRSSRWPGNERTSTEKQLFSRRSPRRSPRRNSPSYHKKERKKKSKSNEGKSRKDLNITLKVPEESLHSLNTEDILSRIINCSDGDVDIDTLRELRSQILGELKQTGTNDDISELILKSYNKKSKPRKKKPEVEEGEISDSESEAIENVYGSLVVMDKDKKTGQVKTAAEKSNQQRKIQICLVINSDKEGENKPPEIDLAESGAFENKSKDVICIDSDEYVSPDNINKPERKVSEAYDNAITKNDKDDVEKAITTEFSESNQSSPENKNVRSDTTVKPVTESSTVTSDSPIKIKSPNKSRITPTKILYSPSQSLQSPSASPVKLQVKDISNKSTKNTANFYKPHPENADTQSTESTVSSIDSSKSLLMSDNDNSTIPTAPTKEQDSNEKTQDTTEIPLLNEPTLPPKAKKDVLSEIDILQALKNEILSENIPIAAAEADTPALHKPQITKVASASEASTLALKPNTTKASNSSGMPKKRISIENYKKKSETVAKSLFVKKRNSNAAREEMKKQSLKLTEKECERFNFPTRLSLDDDTDDVSDDDLLDDDKPLSLYDIYQDLAPKSPDQENFCDAFDEAPVLIPVDPVKTAAFPSKTDVDLRSLSTPLTPTGLTNMVAPTLSLDKSKASPVFEQNKIVPEGNRKALVDPRLKKDSGKLTCNESPMNFEGTPRPSQFPNIPPLLGLGMTPVYTPSYTPSKTLIRTPNARSYEMTPSNQSFEIEEPQQKHVYAPSFSMCDNQEISIAKDSIWEPNRSSNINEDRRSRRDGRNRWETSRGSSTQRASQPNYNPRNDKFIIDRRDSYSKPLDGPSIGWTDCPGTPSSSFGRLEASMTPNHPFGRSDCPSTPSHPFGRSDCPNTPSHPFGRSECPSTPSHPFGRSDFKDPRLNRRQSDYESRNHNERDRGYQNDRSYNRTNSYNPSGRQYSGSDSPRNYDREQHGRNDRYPKEQGSKNYSIELSERSFDRSRRDLSLNGALPKDDNSRLFTRSRDERYDGRYADNDSRRNQSERSFGRPMPEESSQTRATSIGRCEYGNSLSVKPQAGRSFTIDTSVNATFQNLFESGKGIQVFDYTLDARRQRASSVGRSLVRESSVDRTHEAKFKEAQSTYTKYIQRRSNFQRAGSVGRILVSDKNERSFQEIKADFESYRLDSTKKNTTALSKGDDISSKKATEVVSKENNSNVKKPTSESNSRSRKEDFEKHSRSSCHNSKQPYSPRKNNRDPRVRMDQKDSKNNRNDRSSSNSWDRRRSGISYSNDNIAKGTIMGTGFGVKNYKIPKIKRPEPERPKTPIAEVIEVSEKITTSSPKTDISKKLKADKKSKSKNTYNEVSEKINTPISKTHSGKTLSVGRSNEKKDKVKSDDSSISKNKTKLKLAIVSDDDSEKRVTRSSKKSDSNLNEEPIKKIKRVRKAIIDDSDSDVEMQPNISNENTKIKSKPTINKESETLTKQIISKGSMKGKRVNESEETTKSTANKESSKQHKVNTESEISTAEKELRKSLDEDSLDSSFGIDDLEIFSDNIASDPVVDNINELIADLDHDLGTTKSGNDSFTTKIEKIVGAIDNQEENTLGDISDLIENDLNESNEVLKNVVQKDDNNVLNNEIESVTGPQNTATPTIAAVVSQKPEQTNEDTTSKKTTLTQQPTDPKVLTVAAVVSQKREQTNENTTSNKTTLTQQRTDPKVLLDKKSQEKDTKNSITASNDEIVSTTHIDQSNSNEDHLTEFTTDQKIGNSEQSAPDSTIVQNDDKPHESLPDSTMEIHSEISSDVTSTLNDAEKSSKENAELSARKEISAIESFGNLLSILQDKSKIKELLSMLGEQSGESEKMKKKLEKLSEIVSDEEEANDDQSRDSNTKKTFDSQSNETTIQTTDTLKEVNKINKPSVANEVDTTVKISNTENINKEELAKDEQSDDNNDKAESSQDPILKQVASNIGEPDIITQTNDNNINDNQNNDELHDDLESIENLDEQVNERMEKASPKKAKVTRRGRGRAKRSRVIPKRGNKPSEIKTPELKPKIQRKTKSRELQTLQNDIKEMFMRDDVLNATGIRMCRLAKMVDKKKDNDSPPKDNEPVVVLQKYKGTESVEEPVKKIRKKPGPKPKPKIVNEPTTTKKDKSLDTEDKIDKLKSIAGYKPGPKSKTKQKHDTMDPYEFETDSVADTNTTKDSDANSSDSENESLVSSESYGSSEVLADIKKKPKKKRNSWQTGVIKPRHKKKKEQEPSNKSPEVSNQLPSLKSFTIPDLNCFTDKMYCFQRGVFTYDCRLCPYSGTEIVNHYKKQHAHTEVPLSRMDPDTAKKAIQQCEEINFQAISKIPSEKYTCRFCYKEFSKNRVALETFFWHVVSTHTGEYKHLCYECVNVTRCPFNLDIPPPPKEVKGQLIGYICGKCNFTQISLENLKTHVIVRHNDEQTEVYTINLGVMTPKAMKAMLRKSLTEEKKPRVLRSSRSNQSTLEASDDQSEITCSDRLSEVGSAVPKIEEPDPHIDAALAKVKRSINLGPMKSKIRFETDDQERSDETSVKIEKEHESEYANEPSHLDDTYNESEAIDETHNETSELDQTDETVRLEERTNESLDHTFNTTAESDHTHKVDPSLKRTQDLKVNKNIPKPRGIIDVFEKPHFKLNYKESGAKEYVCCVNGDENHYKTTLLISLKKHVQTKHFKNWDGYCCVCKVIVTLQGVQSSFKDCLTHFLDKHMDDFPVIEKVVQDTNEDSRSSQRSSFDASNVERTESPRTYIAVRPLSDLISKDVDADPPVCEDSESPCPVIKDMVSLGDKTVEAPQASPVYPTTSTEVVSGLKKQFLYEEVQAEIMSKKHRIVLDTMMPKEMLIRVFKCAGQFCSFTSDSVDDSLIHASAHKILGGEGALDCAYCNFDAGKNAVDLVMHVFKMHSKCLYSCVLCFYRAAADQLVGAHFSKAHGSTGKAPKVLRSTSYVGSKIAVDQPTKMLVRDVAVPFYICNHGEGSCKFRTYTPGKFCEHLQQKHKSADFHPCNLCKVLTPSAGELIKHMKSHGIKLYQCTWCVHGANTETEMLSHAASLHPTENPQAYLRIITNKDGSTDLRVLPLIYLNKLKVPIEDVTPSKVTEDPTREAERSIELEKLIRHTTLMLETESDNLSSNHISENPEVTETPAETIAELSDMSDVQTVEAIENSLLSSPEKACHMKQPTTSAVKDKPKTPTLNQKIEHFVYCLDSDEEEEAVVQNKEVTEEKAAITAVIDLSDEEPADKSVQDMPTLKQLVSEPVSGEPPKSDKPKFKKLPLEVLYKCPSCEQNSRNVGGFKRHTNNCCLELTTIRCPHTPCPIVLTNITQLINHYNKDHNVLNITKHYYCGICKSRWSTLNVTKKHLKDAHNVNKVVITSKLEDDGTYTFTVGKETRPAVGPLKRKASVETPKKFGIEDIDKLPINPIMDSLVYCNICEFSTKVRLNMVRHLQLHAERQPVPQTAPVNPVPHLETNEKHFDKMVNLASSSAATRADKLATVTPEAISRYPKYVSDRQRHTCGAKGCSYISVDEGMLRIHWETLHSAAVDYHCAHCPPHQHLDTSKILTASRIIAHLKMHDACLYACSSCTYYHYKKQIVDKHISDIHKDKSGHVLIVREEGTALQTPAAVGTMDLKPWQCGLCQFKSMLRRDVVEHCSKHHQTKMQYKCAYCPFRTSDVENIVKHQSNAHPAKVEDVFYYYYREGEVPNEADGTPRWQKQRQKCGIQDTEIKTETEPDTTSVQPLSKTVPIDLNLVKKEVDDTQSEQRHCVTSAEMSIEDLCKMYGQFCDPNGISYKCSLCKTVMEYTRDAMQSHLYEELKYRRWSCAICTYKAYHRAGLNEHMASEHSRNFIQPSELPVNVNIEKWVSELLKHQSAIIERNKVNAQPKIVTEKPIAGPSKVVEPPKPVLSSDSELEQAFGSLGSPNDNSYSCPKCKILFKNEDEMRNHLESELTRIRWCCTKCTDKFPTFHEAQFHCKSHPGLLSRPKEAIRDPSLRAAWVTAVIATQKKSMKPNSTRHVIENIDQDENSLLVVRYEEAAPTEEQLREIAREDQLKEARKRSLESDSDDEDGMVICEPDSKKINDRNCPFCDFVSKSSNQYKLCMRDHILRHYNLKLLTCNYCAFNGQRKQMYTHLQAVHPGLPHIWKQTDIPNCLPSEYNLKPRRNEKKIEKRTDDDKKKVCLHCEASVSEHSLITHLHGNKPSEFGDKGDVVVKCCICLTLRLTLESMQAHYKDAHPDITNLNYAFFKLQIDTREVQSCGICSRRFTFLRDLRIHHSAMHGSFNLSYNTVPYRPEEDDHETRGKRKLEDPNRPIAKRVARKSTSKLPDNKNVAKKSTTKLPIAVYLDSDSEDEFSYYGTKPSADKYENVKTMMPMYNTMVEIDVKKLSGILRIDPKVVVKDFRQKYTDKTKRKTP